VSEIAQLRVLFRVHLKIFRHRFISHICRSRLMSATIGLFLVFYSATAYTIFSSGLSHIARLPAAGDMLADRVIYLIFFCFFMMLTFSASIASYISLFRSRETSWMLTLPLTHRVVCLWKCMEAALFSSWGLIFISAPLFIAFAQHRGVGWVFYLKTLTSLIPFVIIISGLAVSFMLITVRWFKRSHLIYAAVAIGLFMTFSIVKAYTSDKKLAEESGLNTALTFQLVLRHTDISTSPLLPSAWLAKSTIDWSRPWRQGNDPLNIALLYSNSLMILLITCWLARRYFFAARSRSLQHVAISAARIRMQQTNNSSTTALNQRRFNLPSSPLIALSLKDIRTFIREPGQWLQFLIIFGLLALYAMSLRHMAYDRSNPQEAHLFAFLNLTVCALALSTLTTRFVFPQFSLEGQRFWILAMSPLRLPRIILQKFVLSTLFTGTTTFIILLISGHMLELPSNDTAFFATAILLLSIGLNAIAVGFGTIFPNLKETNSAKIVSGFGGTLCLIISFAYVALFIGSLVFARLALLKTTSSPGIIDVFENRAALIALSTAFITTALATILPIAFSIKTIKKLVFLDKL